MLFAIPSASFGCINAMLHQTFLFLGQLWQLFEVSQILEFLGISPPSIENIGICIISKETKPFLDFVKASKIRIRIKYNTVSEFVSLHCIQ